MNHILRLFSLSLLLLALGLSAPTWLAAQDKKDDPVKKDDPAKKDDPKKKDDPAKKKDDVKKKTEFKKEKVDPKTLPPKERVVYDVIFTAKVKKVNGDDPTDLTIEVLLPDATKINAMEMWQYQQLLAIQQAQPKDRFKLSYDYQIALFKKQQDLLTAQDIDIRAVDTVKVRTVDPPMEFDDKGFPKVWTNKELLALKAGSRLPGYPSMLEYVRVGQDVQVYLLRPKMVRKKGDDSPVREPRAEAVMIVIGSQVK
jgi:hypothetical protein